MLGSERSGDNIGVLVGCGGFVQYAQPLGQGCAQCLVNLSIRTSTRIFIEVLEQVARVLGENIDRTGFQLGHVDLALTNAQLTLDRET